MTHLPVQALRRSGVGERLDPSCPYDVVPRAAADKRSGRAAAQATGDGSEKAA